MEMIPVQSSQLHAIGYDPARSVLAIRFKTGATYEYAEVPKEIFDEFLDSESPGKFFGQHIRGAFEFSRLPNPEESEATS